MNFKSTFLLFACFFYCGFLAAQSKAGTLIPENSKTINNLDYSNIAKRNDLATDTLIPPIFFEDDCSANLTTFTLGDMWGFVSGTNEFFDLEKAQRFTYNSSNYELTEATVFFFGASAVGDGDVTVKIYEADAEGAPGTLVGISNPVKTSEVLVDPEVILPTIFTFSAPVPLTTNQFFVSVDLRDAYDSQDTLSILMTDESCGNAGETYELFGDGTTWAAFDADNSWAIPSNLFMLAIVQSDDVSATKEIVTANQRIQLHDAFPNPANEELIIAYDLEMKTTVQIEIYSITGKLLQHIDKSELTPGRYQERISTENLTSGTYLYGISTDKGRLMNKFVVEK